MMPTHDSPVCEWLQFLVGFQACIWYSSWLLSWWVAILLLNILNLLILAVFYSLVGKWLLFLTVFWAWWQWYTSLSSLWVIVVPLSCITHADIACPWFSSLWVATAPCCVQVYWQYLHLNPQMVNGCVSLCFKHADNIYPWLLRQWVTSDCWVYCVSSLLMMHV